MQRKLKLKSMTLFVALLLVAGILAAGLPDTASVFGGDYAPCRSVSTGFWMKCWAN